MKKKRFAMAAVCAVMTIALAGCSMLSSKLNDITGKLVGNSYTITTYDNYGNRVMTTTGDKINVQGNAVVLLRDQHLPKSQLNRMTRQKRLIS